MYHILSPYPDHQTDPYCICLKISLFAKVYKINCLLYMPDVKACSPRLL